MHFGESLLGPLMGVLFGSGYIISALLHRPQEGGDLYGRANPGMDAIQLLTIHPGILIRHAQIIGSAQSEKHALNWTNYHYGVRNVNCGLEEIL